MTRLVAALEGDLKQIVEAEIHGAGQAVTRGVGRATDGLKDELRGQVVAADLGARLARTWRSRIYPEGMETAGIVWSKAPHIVRAFDEGTVIRARRGLWLAIPTPSAPKRGVGGKRISPATWPEDRLGPLRFVPRRNGGLLVADGLRASFSRNTGSLRGFRRASARAKGTGQGVTTVVMFVLVPQVKMPKRLSIDPSVKRWLVQTPKLIVDSWPDGARR
jgi:hypothetical protein